MVVEVNLIEEVGVIKTGVFFNQLKLFNIFINHLVIWTYFVYFSQHDEVDFFWIQGELFDTKQEEVDKIFFRFKGELIVKIQVFFVEVNQIKTIVVNLKEERVVVVFVLVNYGQTFGKC